ncbi:ankyrin [Trametes maxima]|nr:ankyrin [Trametes maxima]
MASDGASNNERLLAAARSDNEDMLLEVFEEGKFDINAQDGLGNTALHYAASNGYLDILEHLLEYDGCDVDPQNRIEKATPLHLALRIEDADLRKAVFESLLDAGADTRIKDKNGETPIDLIPPEDTEIRALVRKSQAQASISRDDVADDDEDDGEYSGSGSGSDDD